MEPVYIPLVDIPVPTVVSENKKVDASHCDAVRPCGAAFIMTSTILIIIQVSIANTYTGLLAIIIGSLISVLFISVGYLVFSICNYRDGINVMLQTIVIISLLSSICLYIALIVPDNTMTYGANIAASVLGLLGNVSQLLFWYRTR